MTSATEPTVSELSLPAVLGRVATRLEPQAKQVAGALSLIVCWTALNLAGPYAIKIAIDDGIGRGSHETLNMAIGAYVLIKLTSYFVHRGQILLLGRVGETFLRNLRTEVFARMQRLSMPFYDRNKAGVLVSRMTSDVDSLQELVQIGLLMLISNGLLLVLSVAVLASVSPRLTLACLTAVPFVALASWRFARLSRDAYGLVRDRIAQTLSRLQEGITGVRVIQAYAAERNQQAQFAAANGRLYDAHINAAKLQGWYLPVIELAGTGTTALVVLVGGLGVHAGHTTVGTVTFFVLTLSNLFEPIQQFAQLFTQVQSGAASLRKLFGLLDNELDVPEPDEGVALARGGDVRAHGVSFRYPGQGGDVLSRVSFHIRDGEKLALVGPTGAGKSTLAKLVARLYDPSEGRITLGGVDLRDVSGSELRKHVVVVPQEGFLFNASIRDNIRMADGCASDAEVETALAAIGCLERFEKLPNGLDTEVSERGSRLSAGEKQLVSLARAALANPSVLILDEATSSLDPGTEALVEDAMQTLMDGRTVIVIAHRLATSQQADRVGVVTGGGLAELGTHDELMASNGHYASLFRTWQTGLTS